MGVHINIYRICLFLLAAVCQSLLHTQRFIYPQIKTIQSVFSTLVVSDAV